MSVTVRNPERLCSPPAAVLLDLDDTLYPYEPAHREALAAACEKAKNLLSISAQQFEELYGEARSQIKANLAGTASAHSRLLYFQRLVELLGLGTQVLLALDLEQTYWRSYLAGARLLPEVRALLGDLRGAGIPSAVVTDLSAAIQFRKLVYLELERDIDYVVSSEEAGHDKPHPAIFELALEKLEIREGVFWMIGDDPEADIRGASETIGAVTFQRRIFGVAISDRADVVFSGFDELRRLLADSFQSR